MKVRRTLFLEHVFPAFSYAIVLVEDEEDFMLRAKEAAEQSAQMVASAAFDQRRNSLTPKDQPSTFAAWDNGNDGSEASSPGGSDDESEGWGNQVDPWAQLRFLLFSFTLVVSPPRS